MGNLKPYLYYKYRSVFTTLKQTNKTCLTQAKQTCLYMPVTPFVTHEDLQIFFFLTVFSLRLYFSEGFALVGNGVESSSPIHLQLLILKESQTLPLLPMQLPYPKPS